MPTPEAAGHPVNRWYLQLKRIREKLNDVRAENKRHKELLRKVRHHLLDVTAHSDALCSKNGFGRSAKASRQYRTAKALIAAIEKKRGR